jgi:hypothetical protein
MLTSYKFWYIRRDDDGRITEAGIRFFEGEIRDVEVKDTDTGLTSTVERYVRTKRLQEEELAHLASKETKTEMTGERSVVYRKEHFGDISKDDELRTFLDKELAKDKERTPIEEQAIIKDERT